MRLFIAINFTEDILEELEYNIEDLKAEAEKGSFTERENLHLTLAFLDEVEKESLPLVKECMIRALMNIETEPMILSLGGFGSFRRKGKKDRLYYREAVSSKGKKVIKNRNGNKRVVETDRLADLQSAIIRELDASGIYYDDKPFHPHITLARGCRTYPDFDEEWFEEGFENASMTVREISLMESVRHGSRTVYVPVYKLKL